MSNLVANALKFVPAQGTIRTRVWAQADEMHFEVGDTGPGISEPELSHLFERYWTDRRRGQGVGLGLFISKGIVEAHGRRIFVESEIGRGTTFHFTIPASSVAAHATASGH